MKPTFIMVRHGATELDPPERKEEYITGRQNLPLASSGRSEAWRVAKYLAGVDIDCIYCSPLLRSTDTAHIIRAGHPDRPEVYPSDNLLPWDVHAFENEKEADVRKDLQHYMLDVPGLWVPGGESYENHLKSLIPFVEKEGFGAVLAQPERGARVFVHHSRNFPDVKGWFDAGMKHPTEVDSSALIAGVDVHPGEIARYTHNGKNWEREVVPVTEEKAVA